ncbi:hypothetical protein KRR26_34600 [Corallococcus sp. M34]|uniref:hypothetical protein n=1 Tax=Citreicoccus inhibens TaxID=2849499 RepID=UPI001C2382AC|nr:hypothetical protein [Citreicoccus inhibens]MBU8900749.1 hypothetical protein [Citreicoccus inhibens]
MAARSIDGIIVNSTGMNLIRTAITTESGKYTRDPPSTIGPNTQESFRIESNGMMTGAIGSVVYRIDGGGGDLVFHYSNPFAGQNHFDNEAPSQFAIDRNGGDGDNCAISLTVRAI